MTPRPAADARPGPGPDGRQHGVLVHARSRLAAAWWPWLEPDVLARLVRRAVVLTAFGTVTGVLAVLADGSRSDPDGRVLGWVADVRRPRLVDVLDAIGRIAGFTTVVAVGGSLALVSRARTGTWRMAQLLVVAVCGALAVIGAVKLVIPRDRPDAALFDAFSSAFPSGHAARAVVVLGLATWFVSRWRSLATRRILWFVAATGAAVVAASRVYSATHWPSDVLVGLAIGAGWLSVVLAVADEKGVVVRRRRPAPTLPRADDAPTRG